MNLVHAPELRGLSSFRVHRAGVGSCSKSIPAAWCKLHPIYMLEASRGTVTSK